MATVRKQLTDQVAARVAAIPGITGAFIWRVAPFAQTDLPCASVQDQVCESRIAATNVHEHRLTFSVDLFTYDVPSARDLSGLFIESIRSDVRWNAGGIALAINTEPLRDSITTQQEERFIAVAKVEFIVVFRTPVFSPSSVYP